MPVSKERKKKWGQGLVKAASKMKRKKKMAKPGKAPKGGTEAALKAVKAGFGGKKKRAKKKSKKKTNSWW